MYQKKKGFTLIELLVVIAIIGLLSSVILAGLTSARAKGRDARRVADIKSVVNALELYRSSNNAYPAVPTTGTACSASTFNCVGNLTVLVSGGHISALPNDPIASRIGTDLNYRYSVNATGYIILVRSERINNWCRPMTATPNAVIGTWASFPPC